MNKEPDLYLTGAVIFNLQMLGTKRFESVKVYHRKDDKYVCVVTYNSGITEFEGSESSPPAWAYVESDEFLEFTRTKDFDWMDKLCDRIYDVLDNAIE